MTDESALKVQQESEDLAKELGHPWKPHVSRYLASGQGVTAAVIADIGTYGETQVFVTLGKDKVSVGVRQEVPSTIPGVSRVREYLTPFMPITYRPEKPEDGATAVRNALKVQLGYADRACAALRKVVEGA